MNTLFATCALAACTTTAFAEDWSGAYGALSLSTFGGDDTYLDLGIEFETNDVEGASAGLALGYNFQNGNLVYGAEIYANPAGFGLDTPVNPENRFENLMGVKGRLGYAADKFMVYGTLGYAQAERYFANPFVTGNPFDTNAMTYGVGAEMKLSERTFIGLEYQRMAFDIGENEITPTPLFGTASQETDVDMISLRVGIRF